MTCRLVLAGPPGPPAREIRINSGPYASEIDQTDQTDQRIENEAEFGSFCGQELTAPQTDQRTRPRPSAGGFEVLTAAPVIEAVRRAGGTLALRGERLRLSAPDRLPDALVAEVRQHKAAILDLLRSATRSPEPRRPRASKAAGVTTAVRDWERGVGRLASMPTPRHYPEPAWRQLIVDAERFLGRWAPQAASLGWRDWELFGCHRRAPWGRIQGMGLVLLLRGGEIGALTDREAAVRTSGGARQTYRRKSDDPLHPSERCLVWELGR